MKFLSRLKSISIGMLITLLITFAGLFLRYEDPWFVEMSRLQVFDAYNRAMPRIPPDPSPVFVVDLDEKSLGEVGQWPWPRSVIAELLESMRYYHIPVIGFDVVFSEPDQTSPGLVAKRLPTTNDELVEALRLLPTNESLMASQMQQVPVVMGQAAVSASLQGNEGEALTNALSARPEPNQVAVFTSVQGFRGTKLVDDPDPSRFLVNHDVLLYNLMDLESSASGLGMISLDNEVDGIVRRVPLVMKVQGHVKPTLSMEMIRIAMRGNSIFTVVSPGGLDKVGLQTQQGNYQVPVDGRGRVWVYYAEPDRFNTLNNSGRLFVSASDILHRRVPQEQIMGRMALIGTSAVGLVDIRATPMSPRQPGVEVHANLIENILTQQFLRYPIEMTIYEMAAAFISCLLLIFLVPRVGPWITLAVLLGSVTSLVGASYYLFTQQLVFLDFTFGSALSVLVYGILVFSNYSREANEKRQTKAAFGQYLSPDLVNQLAEHPEKLRLGGETKTLTILFCDVRGFTSISEKFRTNPQGLTSLINRLLTPLTQEILQRQGTIDKYMGDCIMAFWNAPIEVPNQEAHAARSALAMFQALDRLNEELRQEAETEGEEFKPLLVGVGINTGEAVVGNVGSQMRFDYSVLGDTVNLASRLEGQSKNYHVDIVLGDHTAQALKDDFCTLELDLIAVKGKIEAERIFALINDSNPDEFEGFRGFEKTHQAMLTAYRDKKWDEAIAFINENKGKLDGTMDNYYDLFIERIEEFKSAPPPEVWDGVYRATSK